MRVIISIYFTPAETRAINVFECIYSCRILANPEPVQCKIVIIKHPIHVIPCQMFASHRHACGAR